MSKITSLERLIVTIIQNFENAETSSDYLLQIEIYCETFKIFGFKSLEFYTLPYSPVVSLDNITDTKIEFMMALQKTNSRSYKVEGNLRNLEISDENVEGKCDTGSSCEINQLNQISKMIFNQLKPFTKYSAGFSMVHENNGKVEYGIQFRYTPIKLDFVVASLKMKNMITNRREIFTALPKPDISKLKFNTYWSELRYPGFLRGVPCYRSQTSLFSAR